MRVLKNRHTGDTGVCGKLRWDRETARLTEVLQEADVFPSVATTDTQGDF